MSTKRFELGNSGVNIAPFVFGGNVFDWTADEQTSFRLLDRFVDQGFNAIDTADVYSAWAPGLTGGESEQVIGKWLTQRKNRDDVVIMTKVGMHEARKGLSAANIQKAVDDSLRRLNTDYVDVYFAHADDESVPLEETLKAFSDLIQAGKVRAIGASNYTKERLEQAMQLSTQAGLASYSVLQPLYNLYDREDYERTLEPLVKQYGFGTISYFSLASGFLTGKYRNKDDLKNASRAAFLEKYFDQRGLNILDALHQVAKDTSTQPAQVALAWLASRDSITAPIASATSLSQLDELLSAFSVELSTENLDQLTAASDYQSAD